MFDSIDKDKVIKSLINKGKDINSIKIKNSIELKVEAIKNSKTITK